MHPRRIVQAVALLAGLVLVVSMTMFSRPETLPRLHARVSDWVSIDTVAVLLNVALFVPLGAAVGLWWRARWLWALVALSVGVETVQYLFRDHRSATLIDVAANSVGAVLGFLAARALLAWWRRRRRGRQRPTGSAGSGMSGSHARGR